MKTFDGIHETFEGDVLYPYADIGGPNLLHISSVTKENRKEHEYTCPYCNKILRPRLGKIRHHFAHKPGERCDQDRYIHSTAKHLLKEKWDGDGPFEISLFGTESCIRAADCFFKKDSCTRRPVKKTLDLNQLYTRCIEEKKYGEFIPDLCLIDDSGKNDPIFIEIWSKHKNSEKKANSQYKIIEIRLKSMEELEVLPRHPISESQSITFTNFERSFINDSCKDYITKNHIKSMIKEKWDSGAPFEIVRTENSECPMLDSCLFSTVGICQSSKERLFNLHEYYTACCVDFKINKQTYDLCLTDETGNSEPIVIEIGESYRTNRYRTVSIQPQSAKSLKRILSTPLVHSSEVALRFFKKNPIDNAEFTGPRLIRYTLDSDCNSSVETGVSCHNYRVHDDSVLFTIVCKESDFSSRDNFISYCYNIIQGREASGRCAPFRKQLTPPAILGCVYKDIARYCRYTDPNGDLTTETKEPGGYHNCFTHHTRRQQ